MPYNTPTQYGDVIGRPVADAWIAFVVIWFVSALVAKKYARRAGGRWVVFRVALVVVVLTVIHFSVERRPLFLWYIHHAAVRTVGAVLALAGMTLALWARYYLGRNWGMPMSEKAGADLVTSGPYASIRHPIYAGVLLAVFGSFLVFGFIWAVVFVAYAAYFLISVPREDAIMARLFPDTYPAYKARTKRLIPGVW